MRSMHKEITRRQAIGAAGAVAGASLVGARLATAEEAASDIAWEAEADYVIVGTGSAGLSAAATCALEGLGDALILEAAPEELRGGNSRVCGQSTFCATSAEGAAAYQTDLNRPYVVEPELVQAWADNIVENGDWLIDSIGADISFNEGAEFPECEAADTIGNYRPNQGRHEDGSGDIWLCIEDAVSDADVPVYYDTRAVKLVADPATKEVFGVEAEDGRRFKARKAVILACGGFEWNQSMMDQYSASGFVGACGIGSTFNRGDGIKMAQALGAELWHMNNFSGKAFGIRVGAADDDTRVANTSISSECHDYIFVDPEGKRFMYEESTGMARHGKLYSGGCWSDLRAPGGVHCIFGQKLYDTAPVAGSVGFTPRLAAIESFQANDDLLRLGIITRSETVAELAEAIDSSEEAVQATLDRYNAFVEAGKDEDFHRGEALAEDGSAETTRSGAYDNASLAGFELEPIEPPYYSCELVPVVINSQGGPKRGAGGEVMDVFGNAVPRLYAAGEMGCVYAYRYNVGGNFSEAISSGRLAARSASKLEPWG